MSVRFEADYRHARHPDLHLRKQIAAYWLLGLHLRWPLRHSHVAEETKLSDLARGHIEARLADDESLSEMLGSVHDVLHQRSVRGRSPGQPLVDRLKAAYSKVNCKLCANQVGAEPCSGGLGDHATLNAGAWCLEPIFDLFRHVVDLAHRVYGPILGGPSKSLKLRLIIEVVGGEQVTGFTSFPNDSVNERGAEITLGLPMDSFDPTHIGHVLYVLMHEVFVHAPEGWIEEVRQPSEQTCSLREGFIDRAALHLLKGWIQSTPPETFSMLLQPVISAVDAAHLERLSPARNNLAARERIQLNTLVVARARGLYWFERLAEHGKADSAARLAACINVFGFSDEQKGSFAVLLDRATQSFERVAREVRQADGAPRHDRYSDLMGNLLEAADSYDPTAVLESLSSFLLEESTDGNLIDNAEF